MKNFIKNFDLNMITDFICFALFLFLVVLIVDIFDKKSIERRENFISIHKENLVIFEDCFKYSDKYYCYIEE